MYVALVVYGTRPEAVKLAPVINELRNSRAVCPIIASTGQHREMLDQVNKLFGLRVDYDLNIIRHRQTLAAMTERVISGITDIVSSIRPAVVLVQGDTTSSFGAALAAFYQKVPVFHVEAGLRTHNFYDPFPEEMNRRLTTQLTTVHLAPTAEARSNLLEEGVSKKDIFVTGNTVIDALMATRAKPTTPQCAELANMASGRSILVTAHRRESWGAPMDRIATALAVLARRFPTVDIVLPVHRNPIVRESLLPPLAHLPNVIVTEPLSYGDMVIAMDRCSLVLTDSGGIQEEAPSLGKPVLVMRETTERPEGVLAGTVRLVGTDEHKIVAEVSRLLDNREAYDEMAHALNPYGDGVAAPRIRQVVEWFLGLSTAPEEFQSTVNSV